eukprot:CAMPEP_0114257412 /NCGR_PEP_ID=MMETSP0058-20121206/18716_1 /TAXON_ID=36894 /ORGANISM="Pyramimonas parkeae, CCMP726" /LENGTH=348 /DNA_ID=CAMNT_0001372131 /DNA_START=319 /DNA_END=1362 /DNA_ORIENTATION=+
MQHGQFQSAAGQLSHRSNAQILPTHEEVDERRITESPGGRDDPAEPSGQGDQSPGHSELRTHRSIAATVARKMAKPLIFPGTWRGSNFWYTVKRPKPVGSETQPRRAGRSPPPSPRARFAPSLGPTMMKGPFVRRDPAGARRPNSCSSTFDSHAPSTWSEPGPLVGEEVFNPPLPYKHVGVVWDSSILPHTKARMHRHHVAALQLRSQTPQEKIAKRNQDIQVLPSTVVLRQSTMRAPPSHRLFLPPAVKKKQVEQITIEMGQQHPVGRVEIEHAMERPSAHVLIVASRPGSVTNTRPPMPKPGVPVKTPSSVSSKTKEQWGGVELKAQSPGVLGVMGGSAPELDGRW